MRRFDRPFGAFTFFLIAGARREVYLAPMFAKIRGIGFRDVVDPEMQARAATWYALDSGVWILGLIAGISLLCGLDFPSTTTCRPTLAEADKRSNEARFARFLCDSPAA